MISSPSAQIVNAVAESHLITSATGESGVPAYGPTMGKSATLPSLFFSTLTSITAVGTAIIALGIAATTAVGPEKRGSHFESAVIGQSTEAEMADAKVQDVEKGESRDERIEMKQ